MELQTEFSKDLSLRFGDDGRLLLRQGGRWISVKLLACFPWSNPHAYISLRDDENVEHALIRDPSDLAGESREALVRAMAVSGFAFEITRIDAIEKDFELRVWRVQTQQGSRRFATKLEDWPRRLAGGEILIEDLAGDLFVIRDEEKLDRPSRKRLWAFVE